MQQQQPTSVEDTTSLNTSVAPNDTSNGPTGTYLDQYIEIDRQEQAARKAGGKNAVPPADAATTSSSPNKNPQGNSTTYDDGDAGRNVEGYGYSNTSPTEGGWNKKAASTTDPAAVDEANDVIDAAEKPATATDSTAAKLADASTPAVVAIPKEEARVLDESKPRAIEMTYTKEELKAGQQQFFDTPDPAFYLGAALLIGCVSIFTWMAEFIFDHGDEKSKYLWAITGGVAGAFLLVPFVYYAITSKHHRVYRKLFDGFAGAFPCAVAAFGITFVYAFGIETIVNTVHYGTKKSQFLIYGTIPLFLVVVLPTFFAMMKFQDKVSQTIRESNPKYTASNYDEHPIRSSGWMYMGVMLRRVIVGWICGVCLAAHVTLPAYALSWAAYGLYTLQEKKGIYVVPVIVIPPVVLLVVLFIIPHTRFLILALWNICKQYFWYPLMNWDPREGGFWYKYDNGITAERLVDRYNYEVRAAEAAYCNKQDAQADAHYLNASSTKEVLDKLGVKYGNIDYSTGTVTDANRAPATVEEAAAQAGQSSSSAPDAQA